MLALKSPQSNKNMKINVTKKKTCLCKKQKAEKKKKITTIIIIIQTKIKTKQIN